MATEIERKFLVSTELWKPADDGVHYVQGYISANFERVVRVRIAGQDAFLTIKSLASNLTMHNFEYAIPLEDARQILEMHCRKPHIEKLRHREMHFGKMWEIDVFLKENDGLVVAEVELESEGEEIVLPDFVTREVSADHRYYNASLYKKPFMGWR